jgi:hypothetical protein
MSTSANLPATISDDGWDDNYDAANDRVIQGTILRCVDGHWRDRDGRTFPPGTQLLALATTEILQHWQDQVPVETIVKTPGEPLPRVKDLNAKIPESEWEEDLNGEPRPPWQKAYVVYLLDKNTAEKFTFLNSTIGARMAVTNLREQVKWMSQLRGESVRPIVELANAPMKTRFGQKLRPDFRIVSWVELGVSIQPTVTPQIERKHGGIKPVEPVSVAEDLHDEVPF